MQTTMSLAFAAARPIKAGQAAGRRRTSQAVLRTPRLLEITIQSFDPKSGKPLKSAKAQIPTKFAPAFRSAIDEIRGEIAGRVEGAHAFATEQALTDAVVGIGAFAAAVNQVIPQGDAHYKSR